MKFTATFLVITAALVSSATSQLRDMRAAKGDICHRSNSEQTFLKINIAEPAFQRHVDHGDAAPGEDVPGMDGFAFDDDCVPRAKATCPPGCPCFTCGQIDSIASSFLSCGENFGGSPGTAGFTLADGIGCSGGACATSDNTLTCALVKVSDGLFVNQPINAVENQACQGIISFHCDDPNRRAARRHLKNSDGILMQTEGET